jgi:hypothetical protein
MKVKRLGITLLVSVTISTLFFLVSCKELAPPVEKKANEIELLEPVEIREYEGEKLYL